MKAAFTLGLALAGLLLTQFPARADCQCLANGKVFEQGQLTCIRLSSGIFLARCEKVLNNSSWKKISDGCPQAAQDEGVIRMALAVPPLRVRPKGETRPY